MRKKSLQICKVYIFLIYKTLYEPGHSERLLTEARILGCRNESLHVFEPRREKTGFLPMRKQRRRSASQ